MNPASGPSDPCSGVDTSSRRELADWIKREARALGFALVGITTAEPFLEAEQRALAWLREGRQGEMAWLTPQRMRLAARPTELLPGARSVIVVGASYRQEPETAPAAAGPLGRIARYAGGEDYHDLLRARMAVLVDRLTHHLGVRPRTRLFVDSSPLLEREAAARAGLGFYGKNSMLLSPGGSYTLLGAIVTDLELEPDTPVVKDCGQCRLCLDACPTGALYDGHAVDATRCLSYLTIELRGPIPTELRPALGNWIFGCDVCQEVCPYNRGRGPLPLDGLRARPSPGPQPALIPLLELDQARFSALFRGSPVKRAKRRGLVRNVAVALGNSGDPAAVPALVRALADPEPLVRGHVAWALGRLSGGQAVSALRGALALEVDPWVRAELAAALRAAQRVP